MPTYNFDVPDWVPAATGDSAETFLGALRLAAAMFWYGRGKITQGTAAAVAGLDRTDFRLAISQYKQDVFAIEPEDLQRELDRIAARYSRTSDG